jgi:hypothetical protein
MLRFDIAPVCSNAYRFQAAVTLAVSAIYVFTPYKWVAVILMLGGLLRGFVSPHKCPSYKVFASITKKMGVAKPVNAGAKMFADKLVAIMGTIMLVTWLLGSGIGNIPAVALMVFATIDLVSGFCAACWAYGLWYKVRGA